MDDNPYRSPKTSGEPQPWPLVIKALLFYSVIFSPSVISAVLVIGGVLGERVWMLIFVPTVSYALNALVESQRK